MKGLFLKKKNQNVLSYVIAIAVALSFSHHAFNIWEREAIMLLAILVVTIPISIWVVFSIIKKLRILLEEEKVSLVLVILAILLGICLSAYLFSAPSSYQSLTIDPQLESNQEIELLEIKVDGSPLDLHQSGVENGWIADGAGLLAISDSRQVTYKFRTHVNAKIEVLFIASPNGGTLKMSSGWFSRTIDLNNPVEKHTLVTQRSNYRFIPTWLFLPFMLLIDGMVFSLLSFIFLYLLQKGTGHFGEVSEERFLSRKTCLMILIGLSILLNIANALTIPLIISSDSPGYLSGAVYLLEYGNLEGQSQNYGPGTTILFTPILFLFGRNPWGMKLLLHLFAIGCVYFGFQITWLLAKKRSLAFGVGMITLLLPDLYFYANYVMSDLPNIFLVLMFTTFYLESVDKSTFRNILLMFLAGTFAFILRSENVLLIAIGIFGLSFKFLDKLVNRVFNNKKIQWEKSEGTLLKRMIIAILIAMLPVLFFSIENYSRNGYFGLRGSPGTVLYDGWIYYSEASGIEIIDESSPAFQEIDTLIAQYPVQITDSTGVATGGEIYHSLVKSGLTPEESYQLLIRATKDSLQKNLDLIPQILRLKIRDAFKPKITHVVTFPLPGESFASGEKYSTYFEDLIVRIPLFIKTQRYLYDIFHQNLAGIYRLVSIASFISIFFMMFQKPLQRWLILGLVTLTRIVISNMISLAMWRYTIAGLVLLVIFGVLTLAALAYGFGDFVRLKVQKGDN